jgi:hypothetical protein
LVTLGWPGLRAGRLRRKRQLMAELDRLSGKKVTLQEAACDEDWCRILRHPARSGGAERWAAGWWCVAAVQVDGGVSEQGEPGDVGGIEPVSGCRDMAGGRSAP